MHLAPLVTDVFWCAGTVYQRCKSYWIAASANENEWRGKYATSREGSVLHIEANGKSALMEMPVNTGRR